MIHCELISGPSTGKPKLIVLDIVTQAGTYVKELVHGEFGRTAPSIAKIINMEIDIAFLDVMNIELDFPKSLNRLTTWRLTNHLSKMKMSWNKQFFSLREPKFISSKLSITHHLSFWLLAFHPQTSLKTNCFGNQRPQSVFLGSLRTVDVNSVAWHYRSH